MMEHEMQQILDILGNKEINGRQGFLLLKNCSLFLNGKIVLKEILIGYGLIYDIGNNLGVGNNITHVDLNGRMVLPGCIDCHVHFREPGEGFKGDWQTESIAALAGGVTSVLDMPNNVPPAITNEILLEKRLIASEKSAVDFGFFIGFSDNNLDEIRKAKNIAGVKVYLNVTTGSLHVTDEKLILSVFRENARVVVHAEDDALEMAIALAKKAGRKSLYIAHVSSANEVSILKREKGLTLYAEVTPHHLLLTKKDTIKMKGFADMKPCLKTEQDCSALWEAIEMGMIHTIATDHAPHTIEEKKLYPWPMGIPSIELYLPLMLNEVNERRIHLGKLIDLTSRNPARIFGIKGKGELSKGMSADLSIIELDTKKIVDEKCIYTKHGWSPYIGRCLKGWPIMTFLRGTLAWPETSLTKSVGNELQFEPSR